MATTGRPLGSHVGSIPEDLRTLMGNRIFGCDDCQIFGPWNPYARLTREGDFTPRHGLDQRALLDLFGWSAAEYLANIEGSAIRRAGYERWLRNLAVAIGNGPPDAAALAALRARRATASELVREHIDWAIGRLEPAGVSGAPERASHTLAVWSNEAVTRRRPSRLNSTETTWS